tara:strand:+ start:494 stop:772 length:279 start_codon:yes stop_codon:yes gene_type:complete
MNTKLADTINELQQSVNQNTTAGDALERLLACFTIRPDGTVGYNPDGITKTDKTCCHCKNTRGLITLSNGDSYCEKHYEEDGIYVAAQLQNN